MILRLTWLTFLTLRAWSGAPSLPGPESLIDLRDRFVTSIKAEEKPGLLVKIARTTPTSSDDVNALFDLFSRFADSPTRTAVMSSLGQLTPAHKELESTFLYFLEDTAPEALIFGINGALRIRSLEAVEPIRKIAKRRFSAPNASQIEILSEKNQWWVQFEALSALAQLDAKSARSLLIKKSHEAPQVAAILAANDWETALPLALSWSRGGRVEREMARHALAADVDHAQLRGTRATLLKILLDPKSDHEARHQLALKTGLSSTETDVSELLGEHGKTTDPKTKIFLEAAIFASRSQQAVPLLESYVRENAEPLSRAGALSQLRDMLPKERYRALLEWVHTNDADAENRDEAARQLK